MFDDFNALGFYEIILVTTGAILGSWARFYLSNIFNLTFSKKYIGTLLVNTIATFLLALLASSSFLSMRYLSNYFFSIGFLGGLSTFSTFIIQSFQALINQSWVDAFLIVFSSILITFIASFIGFAIGFS